MWSSGDVVVQRQVWRGRPWSAGTVHVVADDDDLLATYVVEGAPFGFAHDHPLGAHPWANKRAWHGHGSLQLQRPGEAHAIFVFWHGPAREFAGWYVNFQEPFRRTRIGYDTFDHLLDIWLPAGGGWQWKDRTALAQSVESGRFTLDEVAAIRAEGDRVARELDAGRRWWDDSWADWQPPHEWTPHPLPEDWHVV